MATIVDRGLEHRPAHHLLHAVRGHAEIVAAIAEHAEEKIRTLEAIREAHRGAELDGSAASPGGV